MKREDVNQNRRQLLKWLAGSPALACAGLPLFSAPQTVRRYAGKGDGLIASPEDAINVFDFERIAESVLPPAHWGYMATGTDNDATIQANRDGFLKWRLRPRRLVDVSKIDMSVDVLGKRWPTPIVIAPTSSNVAFHRDGEIAVARAAKAKKHLQVLSNVASTSIEDVNAARGEPVWFQLYPIASWDVTKSVVSRAEKAGCPAIVLTVDLLGGSNRETLKRFAMKDTRDCTACHGDERQHTPNYDGLERPANDTYQTTLTWDFARRLRDSTSMKVLIKGIVTPEDAGREGP